jgi:FKBP-type peptidyl-prolyl cis-trans isomerase SlyD
MDARTEPAIGDQKVVALYFTLKDDQGRVLETNRKGGKPLTYLHGTGAIVRGLEQALVGKKKNDFVAVSVPPQDAWGERRADLVERVLRSTLPAEMEPKIGMRLQGVDPRGRALVAYVASIDGDEITIDKNHPLAGKTLHYEVLVAGVRDATREELAHGHVHGPGGHAH